MPPSASSALASAITRLRHEHELTQEDLALEAGVTVGYLSKIERGLANPSWLVVEHIAEALDVTLVELAREVERTQ